MHYIKIGGALSILRIPLGILVLDQLSTRYLLFHYLNLTYPPLSLSFYFLSVVQSYPRKLLLPSSINFSLPAATFLFPSHSGYTLILTNMHSLAFVRHALTIGLVLVLPCHSLTYWVDDSCRGKIPDAITEGIKMAERANTRLRDAADTDMEVIFKRIFKADKSDVNSYREVTREYIRLTLESQRYITAVTLTNGSLGVEGGIGQFTETQSRPSSDVRLYCDNDVAGPNKRWQLVPDIKGDLRPNSARPAKDQDWVDTINHVRRTRDTMGCQDKNTQGETFSLLPRITPPGENPSRSTVTVSAAFPLTSKSMPWQRHAFLSFKMNLKDF